MAACAGIGAVAWVITIVNLVFLCMAFLRETEPGANENIELGDTQNLAPNINDPIQLQLQPLTIEQPVREDTRTQTL